MNCRNSKGPRRAWTWLTAGLFGAVLALGGSDIQAQTIWDGGSLNFTNTPGGGEQDAIAAQTSLTRDASGPIYNTICEGSPGGAGCGYLGPCNTEWAIGTIANWNTYTYDTWVNTNGCAPPTMVGQAWVCHLIAEDIYLQVNWTGWGSGGSGGFTYNRTTMPLVACDNTLNGGQYPSSAVPAGAESVVTTIATCSFEQEYSDITGITAGRDYEFTTSTGGYITVYEGTSNGTLLGAGYSPLTVTAGTGADLFAHWSVDNTCATAANCITTTVELLPIPPSSCTNTSQYPSSAVTPNGETVTQISGCSYEEEYSIITGVQAGRDYEFTISTGDYITVYQTFNGGTLLGAGYSPLTVTAGNADNMFANWTVDDQCTTTTGCVTTTVQMLPLPPCDNSPNQYPGGAITPLPDGSVTTISTCSYLEEFSQITGIAGGTDYIFDIDGGAGYYITVRSGTSSGAVVGVGFAPLTVTAPDGNDLFAHWTLDATCATQTNICHTTTVQLVLLCTPPTATATISPDCSNGQYTVEVDLTDLGNASSVDITSDVNGVEHAAVTTTGIYTMGPYPSGTPATITVVHNDDALCNLGLGTQSYTCPVVISSFPYCEDFEGLTNCTSTCLGAPCASTFTAVDWQQGSGNGDNANWGLNNGQTPSFTTTGPTVDYVPGTSAGKYVYLESSSPCFPTGVADLLSPAFDISGMTSTNGYRTSFAWHMYGQSMGTMELAVSEDGGPWTPLFTMSGDQGNVWNTFSVDRPLGASQVQYRMRGIVGTNFYSDMAWDYFCVSEAPLCTPPMATASVDATNCPDFNVDVDITDLGDATDVNISYTVNGGTPIDIGPFGTGIQSLGPFTYPDVVNVTVVHNGDAACNLPLGNFSGPALCNDYCTGATPISCATVQLTGTNVGATADGVPSQASGGEATVDNGVWYVFAGDDSQVTLQTCDAGTTFDTRLHVFSGACGSLVGVTGNDDNCGTRSLVVFNAYNGTDYYIAVEGYGTSSGTFVLDIACAALCVPVPTNDDCANAETLTPGSGCTSVPGSTNCANTSAGTNPSCISTFATAPDVFYSFTAGDATQILNFLNVTAANLGYALYDACGGAQITCNAGVVDGADNVLSGLTTGNVYVLRVFSLVGQEGDFDICIKNPCQPPAGLVTPTYYDCASATPGQTDVTVDVTGVGSDPLVDIEINGTVVMSDVGVGTYGPFSYPSGTAVTVVLVTDDSFCDQTYGPFINASNCVTCDGPVLNYSFCYPNNMNQDWLYESDGGGGNFSINFISGSIESSSFDHLTIYDGPDNTYPVLYDHTITATEDLAGLLVTATGNSLFMHATSDASFSCSDNLIPGPWVWQVYCLSCDFPVGNTSNTQVDCLTGTYTVDVDVTDLGDAPDVDIVSDLNGLEQNDVGLGTYTVGPFPTGTPVNITLVHNGNNACDITLPTVNPSSNCIACDNSVLNQSYCYVNNDSHNWSYTSDGNGTLILSFQSGSIESSSFEHLTIYDGPDNSGAILFDHTTFATVDLAGLLVVASGNSLYMEMTSDASFSCDDGLIPGPWNWTVQCVDCTFPVASAAVIENCGGGDFTIQVDVTDASNAGTVNITTDYLGDAEPTGVGTGTYVLGPYPSGSIVNLQVAHSSNPICTLDLGDFKDCCNGVCSGATAAVVGTNTTPALDCGAGASNLGTDEYGASTGGTNARWFYWDAPGNGTLEVTSCPSGVDTRVKIHNGNAGCGSLNPVAANDDACFPSSTAGTFVTPGDHMLIEWDDRWSSNGFDWDLNFTACTPDPNLDLCSTQDPTAHQVSIGSGQTWTGTLDCLSPDDIVPNPYSSTYGWGWAAFELTECANVTIDYCGTASFGFGSLNMYGDCGTIYINSQSYDFSTCGDGNPTIFFNNLTPGFYYYPILWSPPNNAVGPFQVNVNAFAPSIACPTNLTACAATPVVCNDVVTGSTDNLFPSLPANACPFPNGATSGGSLWYSYTATQDENVILSTCGAATTFDTRISVFDGVDCNTLSCYTLGDDKGGACTNRTQIEFFAQNGQTYWIAVHSASPFIHGTFELAIGCGATCPRPVNDNCTSAEGVTSFLADGSGTYTFGDNSCAMNDAMSSCVPLLNNQGMWYSFSSGNNSIHYLDLHTTNEDGSLTSSTMNYAVYDGGCSGDLVASGEVLCSAPGNGDYILLSGLASSTNYILRVGNAGDVGVEGTFSLRVQHPGLDDAGISAINDPEAGLLCTSTINAQVVLTNYGENPLTSVEIHYDMDGLNPQVYNWTGNLAYLGSEVVDLPAFVSPYGVHTFNAYTALPNGNADEIPANDASAVPGVDVTGETVIVEITTDNDPSGIYWEIYDPSYTLLADAYNDGPTYVPNATQSVTLCLTTIGSNHFYFFLYDFLGDGLSNTGNGNGSWRLRNENGGTLIGDNFDGTIDGFASPTFSPQTAIYVNGHEFDLPSGPSNIQPSECNVFTNTLQSKVYTSPVGGVAGYQFEFADPDAGFIRRIARPYNWVKFGDMVTYPLLPGVTYFARVRVDQGAAGYGDDHWGAGCEMGIDPNQVPGCTGLIDDITLPTHSCGVTRAFGGSDKVWAQPVVGATQYQFRFVNIGEGFTRIITKPSYALVLNWVTYPLQDGVTYDVDVNCLVNGQWSGYCGPVCQVTIQNPSSALANRSEMLPDGSELMLWPNPVRDGQVNLLLNGLTDDTQRVTIDVYDMFGKRIRSIEQDNSGEVFNTVLDMQGVASGIYLVNVTVNDKVYQQRVNVQ